MPTLFLFQAVEAWQILAAGFGIILTAAATWYFSRPKTNAEIHRTVVGTKKDEIDAVLAVAREFPALLQQVATAQKKSLDDERTIHEQGNTISELRDELQDCLNTPGTHCIELKETLIAIMNDVEPMILEMDRADLLDRLRDLRKRLR